MPLIRTETYGLSAVKTYGVWDIREVWVIIENRLGVGKKLWFREKAMGFNGLWVLTGMAYKGVDCIYNKL